MDKSRDLLGHNSSRFKYEGGNLEKMEREIIRKVSPEIEKKVTAHIIEALIDTLEQQNYPPEECIRPEVIEAVKKARKSKGIKFKSIEEYDKYLAQL